MTKPPIWRVAAGLLTLYLIWGSTYLAIRVAVETLPPFLMAGIRFLVAGSILTAILWATGSFRASRSQWMLNVWISCLMLLGGNGLVGWAEQTIPSGIATLFVSFCPLMMVIAEWLVSRWTDGKFGARPNGLIFLGLGLGLLGLGLLVGPSLGFSGDNAYDPYRVGALIFACLTWTIGSMMSRYATDPVDPFTGSAIQMLCGGVWLVLTGSLVGEWQATDWHRVSGQSVIAWSYLVVAGSLIGFTTYVWLMNRASPTLVSTYAYVNPVVAVFLGWFLLHEVVNQWTLIAALIIVAGVALITVGKSVKAARPR
jgi:drug/metabolite transporter (DMT)-like permease